MLGRRALVAARPPPATPIPSLAGTDAMPNPTPIATRALAERAGVAMLYLLAASAFLSTALASIAMAGLALAFVLAPPAPRAPWHWSPASLAVVALCLLVVARAAVAALDPSVPHGLLWESALDWCKLLLFIPFAHFLAGERPRALRLLGLALAGLALGMLWRLDWGLLASDPGAFLGERDQYGFTAIATGLYTGSALLGLMLMRERLLARAAQAFPRWSLILAWGLLLGLFALGFLQSQSRGSWVAWLPALLLGLVLAAPARARLDGRVLRRALWIAVLAAVVLVLVAFQADDLLWRMREDLAWISGAREGTAASSLGQRWSAQLVGLSLWLEHPWFGWGPGLSQWLMDLSGDPGVRDGAGVALRHLHNTYLEVLVQFGVAGLFCCALLTLALLTASWRGCAGDRLLRALLIALWCYLLLWELTNYRMVRHDWLMYWILLAGLSQGLGRRLNRAG
ncbi:O-antigen ligase domain-containing protein [Marichromatium sp. AB31]|nr:O-antigen ligase domain-containing protein [Marichromatium sp. AB31]